MSSPTLNTVAPNTTTVDAAVNNNTVAATTEMAANTANEAPANGIAAAVEATPKEEVDIATVIVHNAVQTRPAAAGIVRPVVVQNAPTLAFAQGKTYTMATPVEEFEDWVAYTLYCEEGPTIRILCAKEIVNKRAVSFSALEISQKLLTDHSTYFAALMAGPWKEAKACVLRLPDIRVEDFKRLHLVLLAGAAAARNNIGKPTATVANLTETYILADYFNMTQVQGWLKAALADYLAENRGWASVYVNELLDQVAAANGAEQMHKDKVDDFSNAYLRLKKLVPEQQIMEPVQLVRYLVTHCPRPLMASVISTLDKEFKDDVFSTYLLL